MVIIGDELDLNCWEICGRTIYTGGKSVHSLPDEIWVFKTKLGRVLGVGTEFEDLQKVRGQKQWGDFGMIVESMRRPW